MDSDKDIIQIALKQYNDNKQRRKEYARRNKEKIAEIYKRYYDSHKDAIREQKRQYNMKKRLNNMAELPILIPL
jgi:hypothetical protein